MNQTTGRMNGPHSRIKVEHARDRLAAQLFDRLWERYRHRVSYVQMYEQLLRMHGGTFVNDHIAFRTFAVQEPNIGMHSLGRIFEALGYRAAGVYEFDDKHLTATHYQHAIPEFPKLFVSELKTWELPTEAQAIVQRTVAGHRSGVPIDFLSRLDCVNEKSDLSPLLETLEQWFTQLPWPVPQKNDLHELNRSSQYGAWVMVHGYNVNHFTSLINSHGVDALDDIEKTAQALREAGVPMKSEIEGAVDSMLRQTATESVMIEVPVMEAGQLVGTPWTYAYFELAQRDWKIDSATGKRYRYEGFLGAQATQLFDMTKISGN